MFINTNVGAINAHRNLGMNNTQLGKTMEKLSSGFRINRAADDAAGLAISEKMRFQINGLNQASRNAQDGISLLQTAEGALTEVHSMLQRVNTLANQASNGTYQGTDRDKLQAEVNQLVKEINNITNSTKFNGVDLLKTSGADQKINFQVGTESSNVINIDIKDMSTDSMTMTDKTKLLEAQGLKFEGGKFTDLDGKDVKVFEKGTTTEVTTLNGAFDQAIEVHQAGNQAFDKAAAVDNTDLDSALASLGITANADGELITKDGKLLHLQDADGKVAVAKKASFADETEVADAVANGLLRTDAQVKGDETYKSEAKITDLDITTEAGARSAIAVVEAAIDQVSSQRANFGAVQNRLEHTINNLGVNSENLSASESRIRNADMAKEMTDLTRNQILVQAGTAMLAQANSAPQSVLKLLG
ncbi:flagellin N-terminal helical domain-containing protein [Paenibacillus aquistagni]|uniref:flagellin N-terminal helical domain-containing protein n=1 Tax=Paenibacillus aquistagni TaxID=1852522 RepID=UPI00145ABAAD|nr:flagellin [Paenibacillus aquistagni]NMM54302.1 flagellin [Paenibacillus aquistagni]